MISSTSRQVLGPLYLHVHGHGECEGEENEVKVKRKCKEKCGCYFARFTIHPLSFGSILGGFGSFHHAAATVQIDSSNLAGRNSK